MSPLLTTLAGAGVRPYGFLGSSGGGPTDFQLISTQVLASTASSITFSSIPSTFRHLQVRMTARISTASGTGSFAVNVWFNGDNTSNYSWHTLLGQTATVSSSGAANQPQFALNQTIPSASQASGIFGAGIVDILDYAQTSKYKTSRTLSGWTGAVQLSSGNWRSTAAINSVTVDSNGYAFAVGSRFSLYGWN
jgi:hypothetical protein